NSVAPRAPPLSPPSASTALFRSPERLEVFGRHALQAQAAAAEGDHLQPGQEPGGVIEAGEVGLGDVRAVRFVAGYALVVVDEVRSEEHTSELQSRESLVCRLRLE